jgi:hypothetical protein
MWQGNESVQVAMARCIGRSDVGQELFSSMISVNIQARYKLGHYGDKDIHPLSLVLQFLASRMRTRNNRRESFDPSDFSHKSMIKIIHRYRLDHH